MNQCCCSVTSLLPLLVPPSAGSPPPRALPFRCCVAGDTGLHGDTWDDSGGTLCLGDHAPEVTQTAWLNPVLIPSLSEAGKLPPEWV